jgi:acyl carrier protein
MGGYCETGVLPALPSGKVRLKFLRTMSELKQRIKTLMVENLMLQTTAAEIGDELPLFGPGGLGLDSVDALQLVVALDKNFGLKIKDPEAAKAILRNVNSIAEAVEQKNQEAV